LTAIKQNSKFQLFDDIISTVEQMKEQKLKVETNNEEDIIIWYSKWKEWKKEQNEISKIGVEKYGFRIPERNPEEVTLSGIPFGSLSKEERIEEEIKMREYAMKMETVRMKKKKDRKRGKKKKRKARAKMIAERRRKGRMLTKKNNSW